MKQRGAQGAKVDSVERLYFFLYELKINFKAEIGGHSQFFVVLALVPLETST